MTPVIHCSAGNIHLFPKTTFIQRKEIQLTKHNVSASYTRLTSSSQRLLSRWSSLHLFHICRSGFLSKDGSRIRSIAAVGADATVEEANPAVSGEDTDKIMESPTNSFETSESAPTDPAVSSSKTKRARPARKSEMPQVKDEDLIPGASFTGKVRSIQPFGAFVDFGAFTDGLVHVSRMSEGYVRDVGSLVSIGQEVKVRIIEANKETGRISLTMRDNDDARKIPQRRENTVSGSSDKPRSARKNAARSTQKHDEEQKKSKFVKGQVLNGMVKNIIRSGSFVSLPDSEEGFIPVSEESEGFGNIPGNSSLQVGQEVNVRVLRITRGRVTLTMKKEEDVEELNRKLNKGVWHMATNPFELAFHKNKDIASFLDERDRAQRPSENISSSKNSVAMKEKTDDTMTNSDTLIIDGSTSSTELLEEIPSAESGSTELLSGEEEPVRNLPLSVNAVPETLSEDNNSSRALTGSLLAADLAEIPVPNDTKDSGAAVDTVEEQIRSSESLILEKSGSSASLATDVGSVTNKSKETDNDTKSDSDTKSADGNKKYSSLETPTVTDEVKETDVGSIIVSEDETSSKSLSSQENGGSDDH